MAAASAALKSAASPAMDWSESSTPAPAWPPRTGNASSTDSFAGGTRRDLPGSGLGLSIVAETMSRAGGAVQCLETPGGGATFELLLPSGEGAGTRADAVAVGQS